MLTRLSYIASIVLSLACVLAYVTGQPTEIWVGVGVAAIALLLAPSIFKD